MFDDFDTMQQSDEIIPEEYEDWLCYCARAYEGSKQEQEEYDAYEADSDDDISEDAVYVPHPVPFWSKNS